MLCRSSSDDSSLRAGCVILVPQEPMTSKGLLLLWIIFNLSISAITEAVTWKSSRVFAMRCPTDMSTAGSRPTSMGPLIAAVSAVHHLWVTGVCVSYLSPYPVMGICLAFSLMSNFPANPIQSYPALTFSQSMVSTAPCRTVRVYLTGFLYFTIMVIHYLATCIRGYLGVQGSAYQGPSSSLPSVRFFLTSGNTEPIKWSCIHPYRCRLWEDPRHHTMVGIVLS